MKEIVVLSGKGGTGKTSMVASFAALARDTVLADCDVDAPDLHLLLKPTPRESGEFWGMSKAAIDSRKCTACGLCAELCRFGAISVSRSPESNGRVANSTVYAVDPLACEGCGLCINACPVQAVRAVDTLAGHWYVSDTVFGPLVHARLGVGQENSGKLVSTVKQTAREKAARLGSSTIIIDGPPGIGCPVISSLSGVSAALFITEPTLSGIHDLERVLSLAQHFGVLSFVCINKADVNESNTKKIERYCKSGGVPVLAKLPFDSAVTDALVAGVPVVKYSRGMAARGIERLWETLKAAV